MPEINGVNLPFLPVGGFEELKRQPVPMEQTQPKVAFGDVLNQELSRLKFSAHAQSRLTSREIHLSQEDMMRLETAVARAESKGANSSLVLLRDTAFIVSVRNKTVITAANGDQLKENIFTNIDSAVFA